MGGEAAAIDLCAAIAAAEAALGHPLSERDVQRALDATQAVEGRGRVHRLADDVWLIDDAYNANPSSMAASVSHALELGMHRGGRVVFCLGEMKELGALSEGAHRDVGRVIARAGGARLVVACGEAAYPIAEEAVRGGAEVVRAETTDEALRVLSNRIGGGDTVLVKASRSVGLERVVEGLLAEEGAHG
jgi:UDP-N-acetylmuramoyl-tripeptide--D-alanyl-D-alanine ligase